MIILTEAVDPATASQAELATATAIAQLLGFPVYPLAADDPLVVNDNYHDPVVGAIAHIPPQPTPTPGVWLGSIPAPERYQAVYAAAAAKNIYLLNTPAQHLAAQEFDRAYPYIQDLTPPSVIITQVDQCETLPADFGWPVFVKGTVQSRKDRGWKACVAENPQELRSLVKQLLKPLYPWSRGRVIVRQIVPLRHTRTAANGFPLGREFRVVLYQNQPLSYGYYWDGDDPGKFLSVPEEEGLLERAIATASRLSTPFIAIDLGQLIDGSWTVIETGDPQFAPLACLPMIQFWQELSRQVGSSTPKDTGSLKDSRCLAFN